MYKRKNEDGRKEGDKNSLPFFNLTAFFRKKFSCVSCCQGGNEKFLEKKVFGLQMEKVPQSSTDIWLRQSADKVTTFRFYARLGAKLVKVA